MAIDKPTFDSLFDALVVKPASTHGFQCSGKSLTYIDRTHTVSMIRLGGRMAKAGSISYIICCRHSFLPNLDEKIPKKFESSVFSYPLKLEPSLIKRDPHNLDIKYKPRHLNYNYEVFTHAGKDEGEVREYLIELLELLIAVQTWFIDQPVSELANQIRSNYNRAWIEKLWLKAYEDYAI